MYRINTTDPSEKWRFACPHSKRHSDWRVVDGVFECRSCSRTYDHLIDQRSGQRVAREDIELVGPEADHEGQFGRPTVE